MTKVLELARAELGTTEDPPGSNLTKYGFWYGVDGVPWCVIFLCWLFNQAGERMAFFGGGRTASCSTLLRWYLEQGLMYSAAEVQPGDIVILNFHGTQDPEHCGLVIPRYSGDGDWVRTIEGNTSPGLEGSQDNGGSVAMKLRYPSQIVAVCRPQYKEEEKPVDDIAGHWAEKAIRRCMERGLLKGYPDGSFQPDKPVTRAELAVILDRMMMEGDGK